MPLSVVNFLQVSVVADRLNAFLQGDNLVVAGHHRDSSELETLGEMHRTYRYVTTHAFHMFIKDLGWQAGFLEAAWARANCAGDRTNTPNS